MRLARLLVFFLTLSAIAAVSTNAQTKVSTIPASKDVIVLTLVVRGDTPARVQSLNGGLVRVALRGGPTVGLIPVLSADGITVTLLEISADATTGNEMARQLSKVTLALGASMTYDAPLALEVGLAEIRPPAIGAVSETGESCTLCCLTCGDVTGCACYVEMDCGKCCCPGGGCGCTIAGRPAPDGQSNPGAPSAGCLPTTAKRRVE